MAPPGCQARSQLNPQPGSPSEPGYPHLSTPPLESSPSAPGAIRPHPWDYKAVSQPHAFAVFRGSLRGPQWRKRSARLSGMAGSSRRSVLSSPTRVVASNHLPTTPQNPAYAISACPKRKCSRFAGLHGLNQSVQRGHHSATLKQGIAKLRVLEATMARYAVASPRPSPKRPLFPLCDHFTVPKPRSRAPSSV